MNPSPQSGWTLTTAVSPEPVLPELREGLDPDDVTPGLLGFLVIFAAVLVCIPLFVSMTRKLRGVEHRAGLADAAAGDTDAGATGPDVDPSGSDGPAVVPATPPSRTD